MSTVYKNRIKSLTSIVDIRDRGAYWL
jgi:hypothetical protein